MDIHILDKIFLEILSNIPLMSATSTISLPIIHKIMGLNKRNYRYEEFPLIKYSTTEISCPEKLKEKIDNEILETLMPVISELENYTSKENMKLAYKNIYSLNINKNKLLSLIARGVYLPRKNKITLTSDSDYDTLCHEFLHLASAEYDSKKKISYCGFDIFSKKMKIGRGLTEGYTNLLRERIYNIKSTSYEKELKIAKLMELFFDNPKEMERYYFHHDLPSFIHYMERFVSFKEIIGLLKDVDEMNSTDELLSQLPHYYYIKSLIKLNKWFPRCNPTEEKKQEFNELIQENSFMRISLNGNKFHLKRKSVKIDMDINWKDDCNIEQSKIKK